MDGRLQHSQEFWLGGEEEPKRKSRAFEVTTIFWKEGLFMRLTYRRMEDQKPGSARNQDVAVGEDLNQKFKCFKKLFKLGNVASKLV